MEAKKLVEAIECCRNGLCENCPLQEEICDEFYLETEIIPAELLDLIEDELKQH